MAKPDLNRGVILGRTKPDEGSIYVHMYLDTPGYYFDAHLNPLPESLARSVGLDVDKFAKERRKMEALAKFKSTLEVEMEMGNSPAEQVILAEAGGYKVVDLGNDMAQVLDPDSHVLNSQPLPASMAKSLLEKLTQ